MTGIIPKNHTHKYGDEWITDKDSHWHICDCGDVAEKAKHTFEWVVDKEATEFEVGSKHQECSVCGYSKDNATEIPATHEHSFDKDKWSCDADNHWNECSCGEHENEGPHTFEWVVDKAAEVGVAGKRHQECSVCGYENGVEEEIPALEKDVNVWMIVGICAGVLATGVIVFFVVRKKKKKETEA